MFLYLVYLYPNFARQPATGRTRTSAKDGQKQDSGQATNPVLGARSLSRLLPRLRHSLGVSHRRPAYCVSYIWKRPSALLEACVCVPSRILAAFGLSTTLGGLFAQ